MAAVDGRVVAFLEPIALYHERDLHEAGDGGWLTDHPPAGEVLLPGELGVYGAEGDPVPAAVVDDADLLVVTYGNGVRMSLRVARQLGTEHGLRVRVVDLRWLNPLPLDALLPHVERAGAVLVADECRATGGGIADAVIAGLVERGAGGPFRSVRSVDSYVPLGPAADTVLLQEHELTAAALALAGGRSPAAG
jgi:2-oxoisovalerate dehydrogenase E1 component